MCCYNGEKYVLDTLKALFHQTFNRFELIFIDDGSTDSTSDIVTYFLNGLSNVVYYKQENKGLNESRNKGFELCSKNTEYVIFLDSDDLFHPDLLVTLYENLINLPNASAVFCDHIKINNENDNENDNYGDMYSLFLGIPYKNKTKNKIDLIDVLTGNHRALEATLLINKTKLNEIGGWDVVNFPKGNTIGESISLLINLTLKGDVFFIPKKLYYYRIHPNQITYNLNEIELKTKLNYIYCKFLEKKFTINDSNKIIDYTIKINKHIKFITSWKYILINEKRFFINYYVKAIVNFITLFLSYLTIRKLLKKIMS